MDVLKHKRYKEIQNKLTQWEAMNFLFKINFFREQSTQKSTKSKTDFTQFLSIFFYQMKKIKCLEIELNKWESIDQNQQNQSIIELKQITLESFREIESSKNKK